MGCVRKITTVLFNMGGTLLDSRRLTVACHREVSKKWLNVTLSDDKISLTPPGESLLSNISNCFKKVLTAWRFSFAGQNGTELARNLSH